MPSLDPTDVTNRVIRCIHKYGRSGQWIGRDQYPGLLGLEVNQHVYECVGQEITFRGLVPVADLSWSGSVAPVQAGRCAGLPRLRSHHV